MLSISVLGSLRVVDHGVPTAVTSRRQRALLTALALRHPRAVAVDDLVDAVWAEDPPSRASATLQTYVSRLRSILGDDAIVLAPAGYQLVSETTIDADVARHALTDAEARLPDDPAGAVEIATRALDLWDGTALAEFAGSEWFEPLAVGLAELRDNLTDALADGLVGCGRSMEAVELLEAVVRTHPFRERAWLLLVRALGESGRSTEALRAADRYRTGLRDQTGLHPGPELAPLEAAILAGELSGRPRTSVAAMYTGSPEQAPESVGRRTSLARPTALVGRDETLTELREHVGSHRLVTVLGTGGVGKTRLVAELLATWPDSGSPTAVVELAAVGHAEVADAIAAAVGYRAGPADVEALIGALGNDELLIVLDNCEHVADEVRPIVRALIDHCVGVSVLTTSRTRLALPDEQLLALQPLGTTGEHPPAVDLFVRCLQRHQPRSAVEVADNAVHELCKQLDGIPLAIELAAGRAATLGIEALSARLVSTPELMAIPSADPEAGRHASPRALVSWSYDLLSPADRRLIAVLSTFEGEFDLEAVEQVGGAVLDEAVGPVFGRLIDASVVALGSKPGRCRLLQMIRHFSEERLRGSDDETPARRGHVRWVATQIRAIDVSGPAEAHTVDHLDRLRPDIRAAIQWATRTRDDEGMAAIADGLASALIYRPDAELNKLVLEAATASRSEGTPSSAVLAAAGARAGYQSGSLDTAVGLARRALATPRSSDADEVARGRARHALGVVALYQGRFRDAETEFVEAAHNPSSAPTDRCDAIGGAALAACYAGDRDRSAIFAAQHRALAQAAGSETSHAFADYIDGERALSMGDIEAGTAQLRRAADRAWAARAPFVWGVASTVLVATLVRSGRHRDAAAQLPVLLTRWRRTATWPQLWMSLRLAAEVLSTHRADGVAATVLARATVDPDAPYGATADLERLSHIQSDLADRMGPEALAAATASAEVLSRSQILDLAISTLAGLSSS